MVLWQSSSTVEDVQDALTSGNVSGWDVFAAVAILVLAWPVGVVVRKATARALKKVPNLPEQLVIDGARAARWLVFLIALAWSLSLLGVGVGWVTIIVVVVLVFGVLMLKPMVENTAAGLLLTIRPVYNVGDQIETLGYKGLVTAIASRSTVLKASDGREIHIPNTEVLSKPIVVYTATASRKSSFDVTVVFDTDLDATIELLTKAVASVDGVLKKPPPSVQASGFDNNAITLSLSYWYPSTESSGSSATDGAIRAVKKAIVTAGVKLAKPTVEIDRGSEVSPSAGTATVSQTAADTPKASEPEPGTPKSTKGDS